MEINWAISIGLGILTMNGLVLLSDVKVTSYTKR